MSKISLEPNDSGAGTFSIVSPDSNINRTLTLPDEDGTVLSNAIIGTGPDQIPTNSILPEGYTDQDALDLFNVSGSAPVYACRAWVNFDGTGTVSIRESGNVSSITDSGTGRYTVNFATAMEDNNFSAVTDGYHNTGDTAGSSNVQIRRQAFTTTSVGVRCVTASDVFSDAELASVAVFR